MTVDMVEPSSTLIYALGGNRGHLTRAVNLARRKGPSVVLHQCQLPHAVSATAQIELEPVPLSWGPNQLREYVFRRADEARHLVVDTFPGGVSHELDDSVLDAYEERTLVRRYVRPGTYDNYDELASRFDEVALPYDPSRCEWEGCVDGRYVGPLTRDVSLEDSPEISLVTIGPLGLLPRRWPELFPEDAVNISCPFQSLPRARRYLAIGAGHNLIYELDQLGVSYAAYPLEQRFDDPFRRVDRLGVGIFSRTQLRTFLEN